MSTWSTWFFAIHLQKGPAPLGLVCLPINPVAGKFLNSGDYLSAADLGLGKLEDLRDFGNAVVRPAGWEERAYAPKCLHHT